MMKSPKPPKNRRRFADGGNQSIVIGTSIIVAAMLLLSGLAFRWMYNSNMLFLPDFVERFLGLNEATADPTWNVDELQSLVRDRKLTQADGLRFDATYDNLRASLLARPQEAGVFASVRICYYGEDGESARRAIYRRDGERFVVELYGGDDLSVLKTKKIGANGSLWVYDDETGESRSLPLTDSFFPEYEAGMPSISDLLATVSRFPAEAGGTGDEALADCEILLIETPDSPVYYIAYTMTDLDLREEYYVALEEQVVISAKTHRNGELIYAYETITYLTEPEHFANDDFYLLIP